MQKQDVCFFRMILHVGAAKPPVPFLAQQFKFFVMARFAGDPDDHSDEKESWLQISA